LVVRALQPLAAFSSPHAPRGRYGTQALKYMQAPPSRRHNSILQAFENGNSKGQKNSDNGQQNQESMANALSSILATSVENNIIVQANGLARVLLSQKK
jgi:hypothetical protein